MRRLALWMPTPAMAALSSLLFSTGPAMAATPQLNPGDTAWVLTSTAFVLMMAIPGVALFYGGLVRSKNALSVFTQIFAVVCAVTIMWVTVGYSLTYTSSSTAGLIGGLSKLFLGGISIDSLWVTQANGGAIPEYLFVAFQLAFACVTPCLIVGAFVERMRFPALLIFAVLWSLVVYVPIAHMAWYVTSPDVISDAARAMMQAPPGEVRRRAEAALLAAQSDAGLFQQWGVLDFAGGAAVHICSGVAGLVGALTLGKRAGYGRISMAPHNLALTLIGAALLWVGWLGFNGGSGLRANGTAALAILNTLCGGAAAGMSWMTVEWLSRGKPSMLGLVSGTLAGLVAITPAAGYAGPMGAIAIGMAAGGVSYWFSTSFKNKFQYDDSLDVFGLHCAAGVLGMLAVGVLAHPRFGGTGILDLITRPGVPTMASFDIGAQLIAQLKAVIITVGWSAFASARLYKIADALVGLRPLEDEEARGLDIVDHGERAYSA
jgi:ammonium transporter, Amt family